MNKPLRITLVLALSLLSIHHATADDAVVGALVGGGAGALVGRSIGGRNGTIVGGALGAAAGAAIGSDRGRQRTEYRADFAPPPVYYAQPTYYSPPAYYPQQVYYSPPVRVVERPVYYVQGGYGWDRRHHGRDHDWDRHDRGWRGHHHDD